VSAERTPTPWSIDGELVRGADGTIVALRHRLPAITHLANAEFICRSANCHDDLVAALKMARDYVALTEWSHHAAKDVATIDTALAKAGAVR
jgi:hypothetical protein